MRKKLLMLLTLLLPAALLLAGAAPRQVMLYEFGDKGLTQYLHAAEDCPAAWRVMIALDLVQENDLSARRGGGQALSLCRGRFLRLLERLGAGAHIRRRPRARGH